MRRVLMGLLAVAVRGERRVSPNARLLVGDQMLRAEIG